MERNELYEVSRDEYVGFVDIIQPSARRTEQIEEDNYNVINTYSKKTGKLLCSRMIPTDETGENHFYVYEMPDDDERQAPKPKQKIVLNDKEEVQAFFNILSQLQQEAKHDD